VGLVVGKLWAITDSDLQSRNITVPPEPVRASRIVALWHGVVERTVYFACVVLQKPEGIAVWLAFKAVIRWKSSERDDPRHISGAPIYMIGTAMNVGFGIIGGFIALGRWSFER
jgi:hypothetical protein